MNERHHGSGQDLPDLLDAISASAEDEAGLSTLSDDAMIASVQRRATALRVRRARTRNLVAAASVVAIVGAGFGIGQLAQGVSPVPPATIAPPSGSPECGSVLSPPSTGQLRLAPADGGTSVTEVPEMVVVNDSVVDVVAGFERSVSYALVRDGIVVGARTSELSGYSEAHAAAGGTSEAFSVPLDVAMCDGTPIPEGEAFQLYAYLDVEVAEDTLERRASSYMGPRGGPKVRLWSQAIDLTLARTVPLRAEDWVGHDLACGAPTDEVTRDFQSMFEAGNWPLDITVAAVPDAVRSEPVIRSAVQVGLSADPDDETTYVGTYVQAYLVRDGRVVSARTTQAPGGMWVLSSGRDDLGDGYAEHHGATPVGALLPELAGTSCADGAPLPAGEYEVLVIAHSGVPDVDFHVIADRVLLTLEAPLGSAAPDAAFPSCSAPVPWDGNAPFELVGTHALSDPGAPVSVGPHDVVEGNLALTVALRNTSRDTAYLANVGLARGVVVADGKVVGTVIDPHSEGLVDDVDLLQLPANGTVEIAAVTRLRDCADAEALPPGSYEIWAWVDLTLKESTRGGTAASVTEDVHVVGKIADITLK